MKLPIATRTRSPQFSKTPRSDSFKSNKTYKDSIKGVQDSDSDSSDDDDTDSDRSAVNSSSEADVWDNTSESALSNLTDEFIPDEVSLTLTKYTSRAKKKNTKSGTAHEAFPRRQTFPDELTFPDLKALSDSKHHQLQNPYSSLYKERSFYLEPKLTSRSSGENKFVASDDLYIPNRKTKRHKGKSDEVGNEMTRDNSIVNIDEMAKDIAVFGRKADYNSRKAIKTPPNTPLSHASAVSKRTSRSQLSVIFMNKKRAQSLEKRLSVQTLDDEPFQRYEKTKTGKLMPTGSPRCHHVELPSMKDKYKRDKLLKIERDSQFYQNMKMKRFFSTFEKGLYMY